MLTLEQKMLVRSIIDLLVHNPEMVPELLRIASTRSILSSYGLEGAAIFVSNHYQTDEKYLSGLCGVIDNTKNKDLINILSSSLLHVDKLGGKL